MTTIEIAASYYPLVLAGLIIPFFSLVLIGVAIRWIKNLDK